LAQGTEVFEMSAMEFHPLADLFPMLEAGGADELAADIRANGLRQVIVTFEGKVLDGRNRYRACLAAGVEPRFKEFEGDDPLGYVISLNLTRRHLNDGQRAMVAARIEMLKHGGDRRSQDANLHLGRADAAKMMNISPRSVASAAQVLAKGPPELVEKVVHGVVSVSSAAKSLRPADKYIAKQEAKLGPLNAGHAVASALAFCDGVLTPDMPPAEARLWQNQHTIASALAASHLVHNSRLDDLEELATAISAGTEAQLIQKKLGGLSEDMQTDLTGVRAGQMSALARLRFHGGIDVIKNSLKRTAALINDALGTPGAGMDAFSK
jgi:hypothetical protein